MNIKLSSRLLRVPTILLSFSCSLYTVKAQTNPPTNAVPVIPAEHAGKYNQAIEGMNVPVTFYGKVVDQDGKALPRAQVVLRLQQVHFDPRYVATAEYARSELTTDTDGNFSLTGVTGRGVSVVSLTKPGYELEPNVNRDYGAISGSLEAPMVFRMWDTNIHEKLITGEKKFHIEPDGRTYSIDLIKGTISDTGEGDLKVWVKYVAHPVHGQTNDWSCKIEVVNGGLLEESRSDASMYSAPTNGYVPAFELTQRIKGGQHGSIGKRHFYVMLRNGQEYGRITIELHAPFNTDIGGLIRLEYAVNPSGLRVLKP
jgi:hypothetical protein